MKPPSHPPKGGKTYGHKAPLLTGGAGVGLDSENGCAKSNV